MFDQKVCIVSVRWTHCLTENEGTRHGGSVLLFGRRGRTHSRTHYRCANFARSPAHSWTDGFQAVLYHKVASAGVGPNTCRLS
jgi:hypothetical protein